MSESATEYREWTEADQREHATTPRRAWRYPWHAWMDGSVWRIQRGVAFDRPIHGIQSTLHVHAAQHDQRVWTRRVASDVLEFQFYQNDDIDLDEMQRHLRRPRFTASNTDGVTEDRRPIDVLNEVLQLIRYGPDVLERAAQIINALINIIRSEQS